MSVLFGWVLPYIVIILFLAGMIHRMLVWAHIPVPFKLTVFPSPKTTGGAVADLAKESIGFKSLWRGNKGFWFAAWLFHITLAMIIVGHFVGIAFIGQQFTMFGLTPEQSEHLSVFMGTYAGVGFLIGLALLLIRRFTNPNVRFISVLSDYIMLALLFGIAGSGMFMRWFAEVPYSPVRDFLWGLITLNPVMPPDSPAFLLHFTLVQLLLLYFPYSKLVHACGLFFSRWLIVRPQERQVILK